MRYPHGWPEAEVTSSKSERDEHHITEAAAQRGGQNRLLRSAQQRTGSLYCPWWQERRRSAWISEAMWRSICSRVGSISATTSKQEVVGVQIRQSALPRRYHTARGGLSRHETRAAHRSAS